jgi:hypothetical protein
MNPGATIAIRTDKNVMCVEVITLKNFYSDVFCYGLKIPGKIPFYKVTNNEHIKLLKFVDALTLHPMFTNVFNG